MSYQREKGRFIHSLVTTQYTENTSLFAFIYFHTCFTIRNYYLPSQQIIIVVAMCIMTNSVLYRFKHWKNADQLLKNANKHVLLTYTHASK